MPCCGRRVGGAGRSSAVSAKSVDRWQKSDAVSNQESTKAPKARVDAQRYRQTASGLSQQAAKGQPGSVDRTREDGNSPGGFIVQLAGLS
jgi:hypothetical protein